MSFEKKCPACDERLNLYAKRCACGWTEAKSEAKAPAHTMTCTWHSMGLSCKYPVGRFEQGMKSGWCIFHRHTGEGPPAAQIAHASQDHTQEQYVGRALLQTYGRGDNENVAKLRATLRRPGGNVGALAASMIPARQPGADESEAA